MLEEAKLAVLEDLGPDIPQITVQAFMDFLAPPQPEFDLEAMMETLKARGILTTSGRWRAFNTEPKNQTGGEDATFKPMEDIFNGVVDAVIANSNSKLTADNCSVDFLQNPYMTPMSTVMHNVTKPDGYMLVKDRLKSKNVSWADIVLSCKYKRAGRDVDLDDVCILQECTMDIRLPLTIGRANVLMEHAIYHGGRSVSQSNIWHDH
jgi:hypothetical protein